MQNILFTLLKWDLITFYSLSHFYFVVVFHSFIRSLIHSFYLITFANRLKDRQKIHTDRHTYIYYLQFVNSSCCFLCATFFTAKWKSKQKSINSAIIVRSFFLCLLLFSLIFVLLFIFLIHFSILHLTL